MKGFKMVTKKLLGTMFVFSLLAMAPSVLGMMEEGGEASVAVTTETVTPGGPQTIPVILVESGTGTKDAEQKNGPVGTSTADQAVTPNSSTVTVVTKPAQPETTLSYAMKRKMNLAIGTAAIAAASYAAVLLGWNHGGTMLKAGLKELGSMVYNHPFMSLGIAGMVCAVNKYVLPLVKMNLTVNKTLRGVNWVGKRIKEKAASAYNWLRGRKK